jgi:ABC-type dipeptide/oligopeptide/nickel transport system permease subunit
VIASSLQSRVFVRRHATVASGVIFIAIILLAIFGPFLAPHSPYQPVGPVYSGPTASTTLGTDFLGRDVLSRVLCGGRSVLELAVIVTVLAYIAGLAVGMIAGFSKSLIDPLFMRSVDVLLSFPSLILMLLIITALGTGEVPLVVGAAVVQVPSVARIVRTATLQQSVRGFVESAEARGEKMPVILWREILPNISGPIAADGGLRITYSILIIASVNFLGLGLQPPAADWGLMVAENRAGISLNPLAVLVPAALIAVLTISLNLFADGILRMRQER